MAQLLGTVELKKKDGTHKMAKDALEGKVVGLYFSAHWCPPCRQFTPVLKDFYEELADDGEFEIVFVSFDHSEEELMEYVNEAHGDWYYIPFGYQAIQDLAKKFDVSGIPTLVILNANGDVVTKNGRADVSGKPPKAALSSWK